MFPDGYFTPSYFASRYFERPATPVPVTTARSGGGNMLMKREAPIVPHDNRQRAAILTALEDEW